MYLTVVNENYYLHYNGNIVIMQLQFINGEQIMKFLDIRIILKSGQPIEIFGAKQVFPDVEAEIADAHNQISRKEWLEYTTSEEMAVIVDSQEIAMISIVQGNYPDA